MQSFDKRYILVIFIVLIIGHMPQTLGKFFKGLGQFSMSQISTPNAGIDKTYPPNVPPLIDQLRSMHVAEFTISPELVKGTLMHLTVALYPIKVTQNAPTLVFAAKELRAVETRCHVDYINAEVGVATCPTGDHSL